MSGSKPSFAYDGGDVRTWQRRLRRKVRRLLGDWPEEKCALRPRRLWKCENKWGDIEKIVFTAEPGADVPAYVCLPRHVKPPYIFCICLQGHSSGMHNSIAARRDDDNVPHESGDDGDFGLACMRRGIAALCIEQRAFGERREQQMPNVTGCVEASMHALMLGRTLIGERVYDVERGLDYLATRGDVCMDAIGVMGHSGGGTVSMFSAALLRRIAWAMPSCYFCTFKDSIMSLIHCPCNYVPGLLNYAEMSDIMGLFAPKPVVIVAGREDPIFPVPATRKAFRALKRIYAACGAEERCHLVEGPEGHRFYAAKAWPVMMKEMLDG